MCELSFLLFNCVCIGSIGLVGADNASTDEGDSLSRLSRDSRLPANCFEEWKVEERFIKRFFQLFYEKVSRLLLEVLGFIAIYEDFEVNVG